MPVMQPVLSRAKLLHASPHFMDGLAGFGCPSLSYYPNTTQQRDRPAFKSRLILVAQDCLSR